MPQLTVESLSVHYGSARALSDVSFQLDAGSTLAVLGPNGAGKSSLARALSGLVPTSSGVVCFDGVEIAGMRPERIRRLGVTHLPEGRGIFSSLSVLENLRMAVRWTGTRKERSEMVERIFELFPILRDRKNQRAGSLSGGEQQILSLGRGLAVSPKLLIVDEMSLGLAPLIVQQIFEFLAEEREKGVSIILIEQFIHKALAMADQVLILQRGSLGWSGPAEDAKGQVIERYLGSSAEEELVGE
jgi:branched-chain amino acid transport system ATP-binding protein